MNGPPRRTALVAGATGLVGRALLPLLLARYARVHALLRRPASLPADPRLQTTLVDFAQLRERLPSVDDVFCALGTTIAVAGSQAAFRAIDFDAVLTLALASHAVGATRFAVVSALGADPKAHAFYNRVKGEMECAVARVGFERVVIARPSLLAGDRHALGQPARRGERIALALARPIAPLLPAGLRPIAADTLARALLRALQDLPDGVHAVDSATLQRLGAQPLPA